MFPCACSLRSTQCAALIALATAAGISRFEAPAASAAVAPTRNVATIESNVLRGRAVVFYHVLRTLAPWLNRDAAIQCAATPTSQSAAFSGHGTALPQGAVPIASNGLLPCFAGFPVSQPAPAESLLLGPSSRRHSLPFAVGPPGIGNPAIERVVVTLVTGDSAARSQSFEEFATGIHYAPPGIVRGRVAVVEITGPVFGSEFRPEGRTGQNHAARTVSRSTPDRDVSSTRVPGVASHGLRRSGAATGTFIRGFERLMRPALSRHT